MIRTVSLFSKLSDAQVLTLERLSVTRKYPKNTILFMEGDESTHLYIIKLGRVCVSVANNEGRNVILNYLSEGEYFGELSLLDGQARSATITTTMACEFIAISRANFQELIQTDSEFSARVMIEIVGRVRSLTNSVKDLALLDVYGRVTGVMEKLSDADGRIENPKVTHQDIADMVGSSREMVSRIMKQLIIGGYIEQSSRYIQVRKKLPHAW